jgi:hypothetical protein
MQNEPNFRKSQVNVTAFIIMNYVQLDTWSIRKNEPKTNPNEPKTNPILADKTPIRTQFKPKQTQFHTNLEILKLVSTSRITKSFLNILRPPRVIVGKTGLIIRKVALSISRAKRGNRELFRIDKMYLEMYDNRIEFYCGMPFLKGADMDSPRNSPSWEFRWRVVAIYVGLMVLAIIIIVVTFFTDIFRTTEEVPQLAWLLLAGVFLIALIATLSNVIKITDAVQDNTAKLEVMTEAVKKSQSVLDKINQVTQLSEETKAIVFQDISRQFLIESVLDKLEHQDIDGAYDIIDDIANCRGYEELAEHLRTEADKRRGATDQERIEQTIKAIEKLFESSQWVIAGTRIEKLISAYPDSDEAKAMRQRLIEKKEERKKVLLNAWNDAVKRHATDRSLEILKELDLYLTPEEGQVLQEAARDVFKDKLHNLGIQFSLAVSGEQWEKAIQVGQEIMRDFPNSRMSEEIREKMDVLKQRVQLQGS